MARRVFFSFHYERDVQRASVVRNCWVTKPNAEAAGFIDSAEWGKLNTQGQATIERWIERQMEGTSVTVVLIGPETSTREWVCDEVRKSYERKNGLLGINIHNIKDWSQRTDTQGQNTFGELGKGSRGESIYFFQVAKTYDWVNDNGYENIGAWIEDAARTVGR